MPQRIIILTEPEAANTNVWLKHRLGHVSSGAGDQTFTRALAFLGDPDDGSVVRARVCGWNIENGDWGLLRSHFAQEGYKINTTDADNVVSHYLVQNFTLNAALADTTRKPSVFKILGDENL